jgi:hypothetical protein
MQAVITHALASGRVAWALHHLPCLYRTRVHALTNGGDAADVPGPNVARVFDADPSLCCSLIATCTFTSEHTLEPLDTSSATAVAASSRSLEQALQEQRQQRHLVWPSLLQGLLPPCIQVGPPHVTVVVRAFRTRVACAVLHVLLFCLYCGYVAFLRHSKVQSNCKWHMLTRTFPEILNIL